MIVTSSIDITVDYIINKYKKVAKFYRINVDYINNYKISCGKNFEWSIVCNEWDDILYRNDVFSIYYRKPRFPDLSAYEPEYRNMINYDILTLINGIVDSFDGKVLTKPSILRKCENKVFQLIYAVKNDILIPTSFIGNDNETMKGIADKKTIIKPVSTGKVYREDECEIYQTSYFEDFEEDISLTPVYVQEYIKKSFEVRITIIDGKIFPIKIESEDKVDWRRECNRNKYSIIDVPEDILRKSLKILEDFRLAFGAFDYIVNEKKEWVFLEVNPNGQWHWLEKELQLNISDEIVQFLLR